MRCGDDVGAFYADRWLGGITLVRLLRDTIFFTTSLAHECYGATCGRSSYVEVINIPCTVILVIFLGNS
jgi:hypothetical protein